MTITQRNWAGTQRWTPSSLHVPADELEVADLVRRTADEGGRLKVVGAAHSWSDAAVAPDRMARLDRMDRVLRVDPERGRVELEGGTPLKVLNAVLHERGLALRSLGSIAEQTVAGVIATGTHGTGGRIPILSALVRGLRLVDGTGRLRVLSDRSEPELFRAARVHLGALGVVTGVELEVVPAFDLEERLELLPFATALERLDELVEDNDHLKLWWLPYTDEVQVYRFNRTRSPRGGRRIGRAVEDSGLTALAFRGLIRAGRLVPPAVPAIHRAVQQVFFGPYRRVAPSHQVFNIAMPPRHDEAEWAVDRRDAPAVLEALRRRIEAGPYRVNFVVEVRFAAADDIPMSPAYGRDTCYVGVYAHGPRWCERYFADAEALMRDHGGRPHWGKAFRLGRDDLEALYPELEAFDRLRRACDPRGVFRNPFVDRVFGLG